MQLPNRKDVNSHIASVVFNSIVAVDRVGAVCCRTLIVVDYLLSSIVECHACFHLFYDTVEPLALVSH